MRFAVLLFAALAMLAQSAGDEKAVVAVVQKTFDGMAAHDGVLALAF